MQSLIRNRPWLNNRAGQHAARYRRRGRRVARCRRRGRPAARSRRRPAARYRRRAWHVARCFPFASNNLKFLDSFEASVFEHAGRIEANQWRDCASVAIFASAGVLRRPNLVEMSSQSLCKWSCNPYTPMQKQRRKTQTKSKTQTKMQPHRHFKIQSHAPGSRPRCRQPPCTT